MNGRLVYCHRWKYLQRNADGFASARSTLLVNYLSRATRGSRIKSGGEEERGLDAYQRKKERDNQCKSGVRIYLCVCTTNAQTNTQVAPCA